MALPGYTAAESLGAQYASVITTRRAPAPSGFVAAFLDQTCYRSCYNDCNRACFAMTGTARSSCLQDCREQDQGCRERCERPGAPPVTTPIPTASGLPIYGNYCGPGHGDDSGNTAPFDAVDAACRRHDLCYRDKGYFHCGCDRDLILEMQTAIPATPSTEGKFAGNLIMAHFLGQPCQCPMCLFGVCVPGLLGFYVGGIGPC